MSGKTMKMMVMLTMTGRCIGCMAQIDVVEATNAAANNDNVRSVWQISKVNQEIAINLINNIEMVFYWNWAAS